MLTEAGCGDAEPVISVPASLLLHAEVGLSDPTYGGALRALRAETGPELDDRVVLVLTLLLERLKGRQSAWATYIAHLPVEYGAVAAALRVQGPPERQVTFCRRSAPRYRLCCYQLER